MVTGQEEAVGLNNAGVGARAFEYIMYCQNNCALWQYYSIVVIV